MYICIAGKNSCAINALKIVLKSKIKKKEILVLPNRSDNGKDSWQPSLKKFAKKKNVKIININNLYKLNDLFFFSIEYERIINVKKFRSKNFFNFHFSLLPKYRGCHTNFLQINNGEKFSGVTLHKIDAGIDSGDIIDKIKFKIKVNDTAEENYLRLMKFSTILFKKYFINCILKRGSKIIFHLFVSVYFFRLP